MDCQITTHHLEPQAIISIRDRRTQDDLPGFLKAAFPQLFGRLRRLGVRPAGPPFVIYHEFGPDSIDASDWIRGPRLRGRGSHPGAIPQRTGRSGPRKRVPDGDRGTHRPAGCLRAPYETPRDDDRPGGTFAICR
jgi:hypothetical protein